MEAEQIPRLEGYVALQTPVVILVGDVAYEGHLLGVVARAVVAFCRPLGTRESRQELRWHIADLGDIGPAELPAPEEPEDPLLELARELARRARECSGQSLAEQLAQARARRST